MHRKRDVGGDDELLLGSVVAMDNDERRPIFRRDTGNHIGICTESDDRASSF